MFLGVLERILADHFYKYHELHSTTSTNWNSDLISVSLVKSLNFTGFVRILIGCNPILAFDISAFTDEILLVESSFSLFVLHGS